MPTSTFIDENKIKVSGSGRPLKYGETAVQVSLSFPKSIIEVIKNQAIKEGMTVNDKIRAIIFETVDLWEWSAANG